MKSNLYERILTGVLLSIFILFIIFINHSITTIGFILLSSISIFEMNNVFKKINKEGILILAIIFNILFLLSSNYLALPYLFFTYTLYNLILYILATFVMKISIENVLTNTFFSIYITLSYTFLLMINDEKWILFAFLISSITDTFAYIFGMLFGRHKLIERLSPKKTIEGSIGGIVGTIIMSVIFFNYLNIPNTLLTYLFMAFLSIISQIGDLFASYIKRSAGIKDYGNILIGHGGIMDRFDSLLMISPFIYIFYLFVI